MAGPGWMVNSLSVLPSLPCTSTGSLARLRGGAGISARARAWGGSQLPASAAPGATAGWRRMRVQHGLAHALAQLGLPVMSMACRALVTFADPGWMRKSPLYCSLLEPQQSGMQSCVVLHGRRQALGTDTTGSARRARACSVGTRGSIRGAGCLRADAALGARRTGRSLRRRRAWRPSRPRAAG